MDSFSGVALADILADVNRLRAAADRQQATVALLAEQSPLYAMRSTAQAERLRGYLLASFETMGLPNDALPFVFEELESGLNPFVVAAAARAVRGERDLAERIVPLLLGAIDRIRQSDDVVCFDPGIASRNSGAPVTALMEMFRTLASLGPHGRQAEPTLRAMLGQRPPAFSNEVLAEIEKTLTAVRDDGIPARDHCCGERPAPIAFEPAPETRRARIDVMATELQDQDGHAFRFGDFFPGRPSVLTFFYTRCMNPNKCSLTITKLARLQKRIDAEGLHNHVNVAAITYDPAFDLPQLLRAYGTDRGMSFDQRNRLLRTTGAFEPFQRWLDLGVGFGSSTVNQHRLDVVVLDRNTMPSARVSRLQWQEDDVFSALELAIAEV
jgi:cytochrome oxidase Cu insertion factor (SCO1/SenC/PrrC family)